MNEIAKQVDLYHNLFLVCLALCILCLVVSVVIFFLLDIRKVMGYLTGRSAKKQIQVLEENNAASGRLVPRERANMQYVAQEMKEDMGIRGVASPGARKVDNVIQNDRTEVQNYDNMKPAFSAGSESTTVLNSGTEEGTSLLQQYHEQGTTEKQSQESSPYKPGNWNTQDSYKPENTNAESKPVVMNSNGSTEVLDGENVKIGTFVIEREIVMIHAEEVI